MKTEPKLTNGFARAYQPSILGAVGITFLLLVFCGCGPGQEESQNGRALENYPRRTVSLICPWAAGGGTDRLSRFVAAQLEQRLGKPVVVVNRTGGSGAAGHSAGALAKPDGHTVTMATFELSTMHWMGISQLTYEDFEPVVQLNADAAAIIVRADAPWTNLAEFVEHIRQSEEKLQMSGTSTGGAWDLARVGFLMEAGLPVDSILWVPAQGSAPSIVELLGGHIDAVCCSLPEAAPQIEAGELKALGVMASERLPEFPDVPTTFEAGIEWEAVGWRGLMLPSGASPELVNLLHEHCREIVESQAFKDFMRKNGFTIVLRGPEEFQTFLAAQDAQWKKVIDAAGYAQE